MNKKLSCPVCDRQEIVESICPNCETDLSPLRMLEELPEVDKTNSLESVIIPVLPDLEPTISENREENRESESSSISNQQILLFIVSFVIFFVFSNIFK
ncbi:MAG: hypothetical protein ACK6A9_13740 [Dolichospermum sp.]|jgi:uncharacterized Zn finger protein (UPF0148 family)|uniref:hypothetical protein n=1 Tax=Dolichospermum sp. FACHB-1091 TaxID=2692798 RepID=UPI001681C298|nr:hypothetical protein [Dolichospermum sp. FACHB-1091]MBD2442364.1 hypothetical protein [Dolichospermum sp. FACHB-1091]MCE2720915.1 hypothetical protein [Anabaena sp. 49628_E55]